MFRLKLPILFKFSNALSQQVLILRLPVILFLLFLLITANHPLLFFPSFCCIAHLLSAMDWSFVLTFCKKGNYHAGVLNKMRHKLKRTRGCPWLNKDKHDGWFQSKRELRDAIQGSQRGEIRLRPQTWELFSGWLTSHWCSDYII